MITDRRTDTLVYFPSDILVIQYKPLSNKNIEIIRRSYLFTEVMYKRKIFSALFLFRFWSVNLASLLVLIDALC